MLLFVALLTISFANDFELHEDAQWRREALKDYEKEIALQAQANWKYYQEMRAAEAEQRAAEAELHAQIADIEQFQKELIEEDKAEADKFARREETLLRDQRDSYLAALHEAKFPENEKSFGITSRSRKFEAKSKKAKSQKNDEAFRIAQAEKRSRKHFQKVVEAEAVEESKAETKLPASAAKPKKKQGKKDSAHEAKWAERAKNARINREAEKLKKQQKAEEKASCASSTGSPKSSADTDSNLSKVSTSASSVDVASKIKKAAFLMCIGTMCAYFCEGN